MLAGTRLACSEVAAVAQGSDPLPNSGGTEDLITSLCAITLWSTVAERLPRTPALSS